MSKLPENKSLTFPHYQITPISSSLIGF